MSSLGRLPGDWSDLVVIWADVPWDAHPVLHRRYALGLSAHTPVLYVDPPSAWRGGPVRRALAPSPGPGPGGSRRGEGPPTIDGELRVIGPQLARLTPSLPPVMSDAGGAVASMLGRRSLRRALAAMGSPTVGSMVAFSPDAPFDAAGADRRVVVVREGAPGSVDARRLDEVDLVVVTSPALADELRSVQPLLLPYGCDDRPASDAGLAAAAPDIQQAWPIAGYVGRLSDRLDLDALEAVAARGISLLLVGPCASPKAVPGLIDLLQSPYVNWVGPRARSALGPYLRAIDVGLVPYLETEANQRAFPTKTLDHLAAGRPVVSTDLASTRWLRSNPEVGGTDSPPSPVDPHSDLVIASTPRSFATAVERLGRQRPSPTAASRRRAFAATHTWDRRIDVLADALGLTAGTAVPAPPQDHPHGGAAPTAENKEAVA